MPSEKSPAELAKRGLDLLPIERIAAALRNQAAMAREPSDKGFNTLVIYQNQLVRDCVKDAPWPPPHRLGNQRAQRVSWYEVKSLSDPFGLAEAVQVALMADLLVISVEAADELPLDLYVWIDLWLPRRHARAGALAALIGIPRRPGAQTATTKEYLRAVARKGRLDFFAREHPQLPEPAATSLRVIVQRAANALRALRQAHNPEFPGHWGINE